MKLYLGAGQKRLDGYTHVDIAATDGIDVVHDLNELPWPWDDGSISIITAEDVVEQAGACPVILGLGVHDPRAAVDGLLDRVEAFGAVGIMNEPFVGMYSALASASSTSSSSPECTVMSVS